MFIPFFFIEKCIKSCIEFFFLGKNRRFYKRKNRTKGNGKELLEDKKV